MYSSSRPNRLRVLPTFLGLIIVLDLCAADAPNRIYDSDKVEIHDLSLPLLTNSNFESFDPDLSMLRISSSKIDRIDRHAFDFMKRLNLLEVIDCRIKDVIPPETFSNLTSLEILTFRNVGLRNVAFNLTNVQELVLSQNEIEDVEENAINGKNINYLDLSENHIKKLENSMASMPKLAMIDLSSNKIEFIGENVFSSNLNLKRVLASKNKIKSTDGLKFSKLKTLDLFANSLSRLPSDAFYQMSLLEDLVLAFNSIKVMEDPFKDLIELKFLNLAWNYIEELHPDLFRNNLYLRQLSLQGNKIRNLKRFFSVHDHLTKLDLSHNQLSHIDSEFFLSMPNLIDLDLSFNSLKSLADTLGVLSNLKVLNVAFNELVLSGVEFSRNHQITHLNLSSNFLDMNLQNLFNNTMLTTVDLSGNAISNFCDGKERLNKLRILNLKNNKIQDLSCLKSNKFGSLCLIDLRNNPLTCGKDLDDLVKILALKKIVPYRVLTEFRADIVKDQCEILTEKESFDKWNLVKSGLCPEGQDLSIPETYSEGKMFEKYIEERKVEDGDDRDEPEEDYLESDESYEESSEEQSINVQGADETQVAKNYVKENHFIIIPIGKLIKDTFKVDGAKDAQSEKVSWKQINQHPDLVSEYEEEDKRFSHYNWYTVVLGLIGICLTLTCFNLLVFLYIRLKIWRRSEMNKPQKYMFLKNEVYKNTTEPTKMECAAESLWFPKDNFSGGKVFSYGKINQFFQNIGGVKRDPDTESTKNILMPQAMENPNV